MECIGAYLKTHKLRVYCLNYCYTDSFTKAKSAFPLHCIISLWRIVDREFLRVDRAIFPECKVCWWSNLNFEGRGIQVMFS